MVAVRAFRIQRTQRIFAAIENKSSVRSKVLSLTSCRTLPTLPLRQHPCSRFENPTKTEIMLTVTLLVRATRRPA
jgi:hypothetical protein